MTEKSKSPRVAARPSRPLAPGTIIGKVPAGKAGTGRELTPLEKQVYEQAGVPDGARPDLSKTEVGQKLARELMGIKNAATRVPQEELDAINAKLKKRGPLNMPKERDISELEPEEQQEVQDAIEQWMRQEQRARREAEMPESLKSVPGMQEALNLLEDVEENSEEVMQAIEESSGPVDLEQLLLESPYKPMPKKAANKPQTEAPAKQPPEEPQYATPAGGVPPKLTHCPHCGGDVHAEAVIIDAVDKLCFLQEVILGGMRFRKEFTLMGGRIRVVFRSLTPEENQLARRQAMWDFRNDQFANPLDIVDRHTNYRLIMAIEQFERIGSEQGTLHFKPVTDITFDLEDQPTILPQLFSLFNRKVFNSESLFRVLGQRYAKFNRILETLEAKADNENFWTAIE